MYFLFILIASQVWYVLMQATIVWHESNCVGSLQLSQSDATQNGPNPYEFLQRWTWVWSIHFGLDQPEALAYPKGRCYGASTFHCIFSIFIVCLQHIQSRLLYSLNAKLSTGKHYILYTNFTFCFSFWGLCPSEPIYRGFTLDPTGGLWSPDSLPPPREPPPL